MNSSYWDKFNKRAARQNKKEEIEKGMDYALCPKRKKQDKYLPAEPFKFLLNALHKKGSDESRRTDPSQSL